MSEIQFYKVAADALAQCVKLIDSGWANAHVSQIERGKFIVVAHSEKCCCANCPVANTDGTIS
jgi:hypothetical protein